MAEVRLKDLSSILDRLGAIEEWIDRNKNNIKVKVRDPGYYWVKCKSTKAWDIAQWYSPNWYYKYATESFKDNHFSKIGPCLIPPSENG